MKFGYSSIRWKNLDWTLPEILDEISRAGFEFCELQDYEILEFRKRENKLLGALGRKNINVKSVYTYGSLVRTTNGLAYHLLWWKRILPKLLKTCSSLKCEKLVVGGGVQNGKKVRPKDIAVMAKSLNTIGEACNAYGLKATYHPQLGINVEVLNHINELCELTDPQMVNFTLDTGHLALMGTNIEKLISVCNKRIDYVHFKDVRNHRFVEFGEGTINFPSIIDSLKSIGYDDAVVIEDEDRWAFGNPFESVKKAKGYMNAHILVSRQVGAPAMSKTEGSEKMVLKTDNKVAIVKVKGDDIESFVHEAIDRVGGFDPKENSKIVIKPNICSAKKFSKDGVTTDPKIVGAVITYIRKKVKNCDVTIVESDGEFDSAENAFERNGYVKLAKKFKVRLCNLSKEPTEKVNLPNGRYLKTIDAPKILLSMDHFISVAKLKRHIWERYTGIWKNQYGLLTNPKMRQALHPFVSEVLFDVNAKFRPELSIIDGITGLEGPGPVAGKPKQMDLIICSLDPISADVVGAQIIGDNPKRIPHIKYALNHGYKESRKVSVEGEDVTSVENRFNFIPDNVYIRWRLGLLRTKWLTKLKSFLGK